MTRFYVHKTPFFRNDEIYDSYGNIYLDMSLIADFFNDFETKRVDYENTSRILEDFMSILNRLQANPDDKHLQSIARDMLLMMDVDIMEKKESVELEESECKCDDCKTGHGSVKLSQLITSVLELKVLAMYPNSTSLSRDKLYNRLSYLESQLVELKDVNVELERDWWKE